MPYRVPAPPPPEEPAGEEPYAALLRRQRRNMLLAIACTGGTGIAIVVFSIGTSMARPPAQKPAPQTERERATRTIANAETRMQIEQAGFEKNMRAAIDAGWTARPDLGACPVHLSAESGLAHAHGFPLLVVDDTDALPSQAIAEALADLRRAETHLAAGRSDEATLYAQALDRPGRLTYDVVLVTRSKREPHARSETEFVPGRIEGRAYVYDFGSREVVCAADVEARSSDAIGFAYALGNDAPSGDGKSARLAEAVDADMRTQIERAIAKSILYRAGTP